jgi:hypothetical protein
MNAALVAALADVWVAPDGRRARLGGTELQAPSVRRMTEQLGRELYQRFHSGNAGGGDDDPSPVLEAALDEATPHRTSPIVTTPAGDGVVLIDGLRVRVPLTGPEILLPAARPALSPGHYLVDAPTGRIRGGPILRIYLHLCSPDDAPDRWHQVLTALNDAGVTYRAKVVSTPGGYPRRDAMVVYLGPGHWAAATLIRDATAGRPGVGQEHSLFAHPLAPGVAAAWDPHDRRPGHRNLSFGEHRTRVTAEALLRGTDRATALAECFAAASIDPARPARNRDSPALPELGL